MIYKDLNINFADMNVKIKFKQETEIPFQTMDIDALKEIVLSNKKNLQNIEVEGKFSPEIFGLVTFADNFYYNSPEENLEMTKSENLKELKYNDMKINFENCVSGIEEVFSLDETLAYKTARFLLEFSNSFFSEKGFFIKIVFVSSS